MSKFNERPSCPECRNPLAPSKFGGRGSYWCPTAFKYKKDPKGQKCTFKGIKGTPWNAPVSTEPIAILKTASVEQQAIFDFSATSDSNMLIEALAGTGKTTVAVQQVRIYTDMGYSVAIMAFARRDRKAIHGRINSCGKVKTSAGWGLSILNQYSRGQTKKPVTVVWENYVNDILFKMFKDDSLIDVETGEWKVKRTVFTAILGIVEKVRSTLPLSQSGFPYKKEASEKDFKDVALQFNIEYEEADFPTILRYCQILMTLLSSLSYMLKHGTDGTGMTFLPVYHQMKSNEQFDRIIVDEAQDQSYYTRMIVELYRKPRGKIVAVGDKNQAIYAWRGADGESLDMIEELMAKNGPVKKFPLTLCRRCSKTVIRNVQKMVPSIQGLPDSPEGSEEFITTDEAFMEHLVKNRKGLVICRTNAPLINVCLKLMAKGVAAIVLRSNIVKDMLVIIDNASNGLGSRAPVTKILTYVAEWKQLRIEKLSTYKNMDAKIQLVEDQAACIQALCEDDNVRTAWDLKAKIDRMFEKAYKDEDEDTPDPDKIVVLSTVHGAKGGEAIDTYLYSPNDTEKNVNLWDAVWTTCEDRNNTLYVALSRAKMNHIFVGFMPTLQPINAEMMQQMVVDHAAAVQANAEATVNGTEPRKVVEAEFRVQTDRGPMRIAAKTKEAAEGLAVKDGYRIKKETKPTKKAVPVKKVKVKLVRTKK